MLVLKKDLRKINVKFKIISIGVIILAIIAPIISFAKSDTILTLPIDKIYDGDTIMTHVSEDKLPQPLNKLSIRIRGIDTPERNPRSKCDKEAKLAETAKQFLIKLVNGKNTMEIKDFSWDKFGGRITATVFVGGINVADEMIKNGFAIPYNGEKKTHDWCI